eukprot:TRINITY_DN54756_c0_g1_i1.p1 TRINITY_DN54756_c0_g1~~TRINITY_DN54756_c0_g1_i1.p1  ORF type:complete len:599 (-),score=85.28 TRINITY_DN54756_c0_g1_i1:114-1706(-)
MAPTVETDGLEDESDYWAECPLCDEEVLEITKDHLFNDQCHLCEDACWRSALLFTRLGTHKGRALLVTPSYSELSAKDGYHRLQSGSPHKLRTPKAAEEEVAPVSWMTFFGAVANCTNTIIGAGTLAVPKVMSMTGLAGYHVMVISILCITWLSLHWLIEVIDRLPDDVARNYEGIANYYLGLNWATAIAIAFFFGGIGLTMARMLLITTSLTPVLSLMGLGTEQDLEKSVLFGIGLFIVLPLAMLKDMSKLRSTSSLAVFAMLFAVAYVSGTAMAEVATSGLSSGIVLWGDSLAIFTAVAMSVSAYSCHIAVMPIYDSLGPSHTPRTMMNVVLLSLVLSFSFYELVGLSGYLCFGRDVDANILKSMVASNGLTIGSILATFGVSLTLICSIPIVIWPVRSVILWSIQLFAEKREEAETSIVDRRDSVAKAAEFAEKGPTYAEWTGVTAGIMIVVLVLAWACPDVKKSLSVVGSLGGAFIVFIYPAAFHLSVVKKVSPSEWTFQKHRLELMVIVMGIFVGTVCLSVTLLS